MSDACTITQALRGRWYGRHGLSYCPAHDNTRTPALVVQDGSDGRFLARRHANCDFGTIMAAVLDNRSECPPDFGPSERLRADAAFWADKAHPAELEAYFAAALQRLNKRALGIRVRKRLLVRLWESLPEPDKRAFLCRVDPEERFTGRAA